MAARCAGCRALPVTTHASPIPTFRNTLIACLDRVPVSRHKVKFRRRSDRASGCCALLNSGSPHQPPPLPDPDAPPDEVARWARATFAAAVAGPDDVINLAKVGLLISLEEEAAAQAYRAECDPTALLRDLRAVRAQFSRHALRFMFPTREIFVKLHAAAGCVAAKSERSALARPARVHLQMGHSCGQWI